MFRCPVHVNGVGADGGTRLAHGPVKCESCHSGCRLDNLTKKLTSMVLALVEETVLHMVPRGARFVDAGDGTGPAQASAHLLAFESLHPSRQILVGLSAAPAAAAAG